MEQNALLQSRTYGGYGTLGDESPVEGQARQRSSSVLVGSAGTPSQLDAIGVDPSRLDLSAENSQLVVRPLVYTHPFIRFFSKVEPGSLRGSIFTLSSTAIGAGILALPVVLRDTGLCFGLVLCVIGALLANVSLTMLVTAADAVVYARGLESRRDISYSEIVAVLLGPKMSVVMQVTLFVYCFGTTVGYLLVIGGSIDSFCSATHIALPSPSLPVIIAAAVAFPLTLLRNMGDLAYSSLGAILAMLFTSICIMVRAIQHGSFEGLPNPYIRIAPNFCSSATLVFFAYNCHVNIFSIYSDLKVPLLSRIKKVTSRAVWLELLLYTGVAAAGYLTFGDQTQGNILSSYPNSDTLLVVCKMLVGLALTANLPLGVFPARQSLEELLGYHSTTPDAKSAQRSELNAAQGMDALGGADVKEDDRKGNAAEGDAVIATFSPVNVLLTTFIMGGSLVVALYVPGVDIVFSFLGATVCIVVCYILPSAMYHVVLDSQARRNGKSNIWLKFSMWSVTGVLVVVGTISAFDTLSQIFVSQGSE